MITYKCSHGHIFDEDEMVREPYKEGEGTRYRYVCPACGTDDFEEAHVCSWCGFLFREDELEYNVCEKCREELIEEVKEKLREYQGDAREFLYHYFDEGEGAFA